MMFLHLLNILLFLWYIFLQKLLFVLNEYFYLMRFLINIFITIKTVYYEENKCKQSLLFQFFNLMMNFTSFMGVTLYFSLMNLVSGLLKSSMQGKQV